MDIGSIYEAVKTGGMPVLLTLMLVQFYLLFQEMKSHRKELADHRDDEGETRKQLIAMGGQVVQMGTALAVLLDRDNRNTEATTAAVREVVREEISDVHPKVDPREIADDGGPIPLRRRASPGLRVPRPGTKDDTDTGSGGGGRGSR